MAFVFWFIMQHARPARRAAFRVQRGEVRAFLAVGLLGAGCEPLPGYVPSPAPGDPSVRIDEESELAAACPSSLDACGASLTPSCRVSCQPAADGCAEVWELYRMRLPDGYRGEWWGLDADGNHGLFTSYPVPDIECQYPRLCDDAEFDARPTEYSIWSADGVAPFSTADQQLGLAIDEVSDDGRTVLASFELDSLYWTPAAGLQPVPFRGASMARSGRLFAGRVEGGGARWSPGSSIEVIPIDAGISTIVTEGDAALFVSPRSITYSSAVGERTVIELPTDASPEATFGRAVLAAGGASFAVELESPTDVRLYRWSDGAFDLIELPAHPPRTWSIEEVFVSDDGRVVLAEIEYGDDEQGQLVRWSAQTGAQVLSEGARFSTAFLGSAGDVIYGRAKSPNGSPLSLRWTLDAGMVDTSASHVVQRVAFDGDVLVDMDDDGILARKYGRAAGVSLAIDHLRGRLVSKRPFWPLLQSVSSNARVLAGTGSDDPGNEWLWLARLQTTCPGAAD